MSNIINFNEKHVKSEEIMDSSQPGTFISAALALCTGRRSGRAPEANMLTTRAVLRAVEVLP